jgi:hypothetical protein
MRKAFLFLLVILLICPGFRSGLKKTTILGWKCSMPFSWSIVKTSIFEGCILADGDSIHFSTTFSIHSFPPKLLSHYPCYTYDSICEKANRLVTNYNDSLISADPWLLDIKDTILKETHRKFTGGCFPRPGHLARVDFAFTDRSNYLHMYSSIVSSERAKDIMKFFLTVH